MSLRAKLILGFTAITVVLLVPSLIAASRLSRLRDLAVEGRSGHAAAVAGLGRMQALLAQLNRVERSFIATSDSALGAAALATADSLRQAYARFRGSPYGDLGAGLGPIVEDVGTLTVRARDQMLGGGVVEATASFQDMMSRFAAAEGELALVAEGIEDLARREFARADAMAESARAQAFFGIAVALLLTGLLASFVTHTLASPLRRLSRGMARVADGGFEAPMDLPYDRRDEIGELSTSFRTMSRRLADLDRTKSEFFGIVSHELKTPLNVMRAYVELLEDEVDDVASEFHKTLLSDITDQVQAMSQLVSRLMDISRLAAGTYRLAPEPVRVEDLTTELQRTWERRAAEQDVTLEVTLAPSAPSMAIMDVDLIRDEVLGNLITNALRFTPSGGRVEVDVGGIGGGIVFTVTDTGPGIPEEHRTLIFQKHYVVDRRSAVGSGLGLAIAKEMVELHGGVITLHASSAERGARFSVTLPLVPTTPDLEVPATAMIDAEEPDAAETPAGAATEEEEDGGDALTPRPRESPLQDPLPEPAA
jgi:signal transduction histidine kinase